ncbi:hypothetical protein [Burkholderia alba]|uniref:hypothetical protein n=1 Tax=Burkholderia alba TaxID=2683677 RepID=UPI002B05D429|nr:hypothetical protein [Burkholderia alba]
MPPQRARGRKPRSKILLLPLPTAQVQRLQLKHHVALAAVRDGHGDVAQIGTLLNALYLAFYLRDVTGETDRTLYPRADAVLRAYMARAISGDWRLADDERVVLEQLLVVHDAQLAAVPLHRFADAWDRLNALSESGGDSPIPAPVGGTP